jgi:hypothetical protein
VSPKVNDQRRWHRRRYLSLFSTASTSRVYARMESWFPSGTSALKCRGHRRNRPLEVLLPGTGDFADRCRWGTAGEIGFQQVPAARLVYWAPVTTNDPAVNAGFAVSPRRQFPLQGRSPKTASVVPQQHGCVPRQKPHVSHQVRTCFTSEPQLSHPVRTCPTSKPNIRLQDGAKSILSIISRRSSGGKGSPVVVH